MLNKKPISTEGAIDWRKTGTVWFGRTTSVSIRFRLVKATAVRGVYRAEVSQDGGETYTEMGLASVAKGKHNCAVWLNDYLTREGIL